MENYFKRKSTSSLPCANLENDNNDQVSSASKKSRVEVNLADLPADPGLRNPILSYHPMDRDQIRRAYLQKGPCQPRDHKFPFTESAQDKRRFNPAWFKDYGLPFRGHDESEDSNNMGNFLELLQVIGNQNEATKRVILENAPENLKLTSPKIQKDIVNAASMETTQAIISELGDAPFALLVDEYRDISMKEQMAVVLRYVNERGCVI
ncbi:zinc finger MYM-type protein 1-like protein [Cinnamomum micranthum f. kanehirae]|uniref:Zinc finger MYM-type protein 1-like protein n=1 Tax=Cinnamomum micranthum f. kanehirae TaxID=337451 RepID=A0A3S3MUH9_9MAGN|nr:zinc finger MYM-type protein 1-like protein [Cinnamomum micranthum f. kanehirae]